MASFNLKEGWVTFVRLCLFKGGQSAKLFCIFLARDTDPLTETEKEITYVMLFIQ